MEEGRARGMWDDVDGFLLFFHLESANQNCKNKSSWTHTHTCLPSPSSLSSCTATLKTSPSEVGHKFHLLCSPQDADLTTNTLFRTVKRSLVEGNRLELRHDGCAVRRLA